MSDTLQWGLDFIIAVQRFHGPVLDSIFRAITSMGNQDFLFMVVPLIFWCVSTEKGIHITILLTFSTFVNEGLKDLFQQARPFEFDPTVKLAGAWAMISLE